uniref:Uncharacterized protein n=1 Tax=Anthurium amnicola TaxID=1678845 RepID=A0A1D1Y093_9ARAE
MVQKGNGSCEPVEAGDAARGPPGQTHQGEAEEVVLPAGGHHHVHPGLPVRARLLLPGGLPLGGAPSSEQQLPAVEVAGGVRGEGGGHGGAVVVVVGDLAEGVPGEVADGRRGDEEVRGGGGHRAVPPQEEPDGVRAKKDRH